MTRQPCRGAAGMCGREGFLLPAGLFALVIMSVLMIAALRLADDEHRATRGLRESGVALYTAESGLAGTLGAWPAVGVLGLVPGDSLTLAWVTLSNGAKYRTTIHRMDNGGGITLYALVVQGRGAGGLGGRSNITAMVRGIGTKPAGIIAVGPSGSVTLTGIVDSYDSRDGPYSVATASSSVDVIANGNVSMQSSTQLKGDLIAGGTWNGSGSVAGTIQQHVAPAPAPADSFPVDSCPGLIPKYSPAGDIHGTAGTYVDSTGILNVSSGKVDTLFSPAPSGRPNYYLSSLTQSATGKVIIKYTTNPAQKMTIFVDNQVTVSGGGLFNLSGQSALLDIRACGNPASPKTWTVSGGSGAVLQVYAPNHPITVSGGSDFYGSLIGSSVTASGGSRLHFDAATAAALLASTLTIITGSWAETQPF